jgi:VWFA-related protein
VVTQGALTLAASSLVLFALGATTAAQFRSRTDLVELGAVVLDKNGEPVPNLGQADFEIVEDGHPLPIATFAAINANQPATVNDGRFVALLVEPRSSTARKLAREIIDRMGERDVVAILAMHGSKATTTDHRQVALEQLDALASPVAARRSAPRTGIAAVPADGCAECGTGGAVGFDTQTWPGLRIGGLTEPSGFGGTSSYTVNALSQLDTLADQLKQVAHRRKSIVYIGPGAALNLTERAIKDGDTGRWLDVVKHASRADVSVSVISIDGLTGKSYAGARMLADETGGDAVVDTNVYDQGLERVWRHAGQYYLLGYTPGAEKKKAHSIRVRVKRPEVEVHALKTRG